MFAIICTDKPGALETRMANREAHLAYVAETGIVELGGPFLDAEGNMCGSLVILNVENQQEAEDWAAGDPYAKAGLFLKVRIEKWKKVIG